MHLNISETSAKMLKVILEDGNTPLYINEIIRKTNLFPNSVQRSLKTLTSQKILTVKVKGNRRFYKINADYQYLHEIKALVLPIKDARETKYVKWVNRECSVALNAAIGSAQCNPKYIKKFRIDPVDFLWYNSVTGGVYNSLEQVTKTGERISKEVKNDALFAKKLADSCLLDGEKLVAETKKAAQKDLAKSSEKALYVCLKKIIELFYGFMPYYVIPHAIERAIETELDKYVFDQQIKDKLVEPTSVLSGEQTDELELAGLVKKESWTKTNEEKLSKLVEKYCWLPMMALHHSPFDLQYFWKIVDDLVKNLEDPEAELIKLRNKEKERVAELEDTLKEINASKELRNLVYITQAYLNLRTYRVNITKKFHYYHLALLKEIAKRLDLTSEEITFLTYDEILEALKNKKQRKELVLIVAERQKGFVNITWKGKTRVIAGVKNIIQAMEQYNILAQTPLSKKGVKGRPACLGIVTGTVKIVRKISELEKVKKGDVLVARMTTPDYMLAIRNAAAIVTDEGGVTCHAAIVSREFNLPCIVGTKTATQVLSDGDVVEVNANEGIVRVIETVDLPEDVKKLSGKTIFKGKVKGRARIILDSADFAKMQIGDIIITTQTTPDYLSLLYRAKGFIVDEESLSSHAVLYGRALELPSVMGTGCARFLLKDGERIELDATNGLVQRLD